MGERWRDRPRRTLRRWDLGREYELAALAVVGSWVVVVQYAIERPWWAALLALAVAAGLTYGAVLYLRRPVADPPPDAPPPTADDRRRADAERLRWSGGERP
jgi:hypothetical protein